MAERLHLPYEVLSDERLDLTSALGLPVFRYGEWTLLKRCTLLIGQGRIAYVFYPVFPPDADAGRRVDGGTGHGLPPAIFSALQTAGWRVAMRWDTRPG
jgi:hypothetical protein